MPKFLLLVILFSISEKHYVRLRCTSPRCGKVLPHSKKETLSKTCPYCFSKAEVVVIARTTYEEHVNRFNKPAELKQPNFCAECGAKVEQRNDGQPIRFCAHCGYQFLSPHSLSAPVTGMFFSLFVIISL